MYSFFLFCLVQIITYSISIPQVFAQSRLSWEIVAGSQNTEITALKVSDNTLYIATYNKVYVVRNGAWKQIFPVQSDQNEYFPVSLDVEGQRILIGTLGSGVFLSENGGLTWRNIVQGIEQTGRGVIATHILRGATAPFRYMISVDGFGMYVGDGTQWILLNTGISTNTGSSSRVIAPDSRLGFVIGTMANGILYSLGYNLLGGHHEWIPMANSFSPGDAVYDLVIAGDTLIVGSNLGVRLSTNQGRTWTRHTMGIRPESRFLMDIEKIGSTLYAGSLGVTTNIGYVYASNDGGTTWSITNSLLPMENIFALASDREFLYAGTANGLFRARHSTTTSVRSNRVSVMNLTHFPHPVEQSATIQFSLAQTGVAQVTLHDMTGRTIATLAEGMYGAGQHSIPFDVQRLGIPSGMYVYRVRTQEETLAQPLVIVR